MKPVNLHCHSAAGSADAGFDPAGLARRYADAGFGAIAITDHDAVTDPPAEPSLITMRGIEHTMDSSNHFHIVELPDRDFSFLAHPRFTFGAGDDDGDGDGLEAVRRRALSTIEDYDLDGVEKFNGGVKQYEGPLPAGVVELANDDAHNTWQIGSSHMLVPDAVSSPAGVIEAIRAGDHRLAARRSTLHRELGFLSKGVSWLSRELERVVDPRRPPAKTSTFYARLDRDRPRCGPK